ncbi:3-oxoacid CoA-transferase subunit B [Pacificibacter marinus]|uniref:3-oxoacid CoA-transferase subunit B n=1 Tax=Pacificibacter marinus TaxID=658057 RepID=UPI001C0793AC|nr:3-oxoacid CoA-transferase subunit B [Pacificibacter marinus]MBU2867492.1 3-oxoacid CoA-transferase subunit B [Pacificibacter marinus]
MNKMSRSQMAWLVAQDMWDGAVVNLGIGLPTACANFVPEDREIMFHSENGLIGVGPAPDVGDEDPDLINAGKQMVTLVTGGAYFSHNDAFVMIRGGHIDLSVMGAFEVSQAGDLANWTVNAPGVPPGVGGAMDLAAGAKEIWVLMEHTTRDGKPRILKECHFPLTGKGCVTRIYTDIAILMISPRGVEVTAMVEGCDLEKLQAVTEVPLTVHRECKVISPPDIA